MSTLAPYRFAPADLADLVRDIRDDDDRVHDEAYAAYLRITGTPLPQPGQRVGFDSKPFGAVTGVVDRVVLDFDGSFDAVVDTDVPGRPGRLRSHVPVGNLDWIGA